MNLVIRPDLPHLQHEWDQVSHYKGSSGAYKPALIPPLRLKGGLQGELAMALMMGVW